MSSRKIHGGENPACSDGSTILLKKAASSGRLFSEIIFIFAASG